MRPQQAMSLAVLVVPPFFVSRDMDVANVGEMKPHSKKKMDT